MLFLNLVSSICSKKYNKLLLIRRGKNHIIMSGSKWEGLNRQLFARKLTKCESMVKMHPVLFLLLPVGPQILLIKLLNG